MTTLSESEPIARKPYKCIWCAEPIPVGEKHYSRTYLYEGDFKADRMHLECRDAMGRYDWQWNDHFDVGSFTRGATCERGCEGCELCRPATGVTECP